MSCVRAASRASKDFSIILSMLGEYMLGKWGPAFQRAEGMG